MLRILQETRSTPEHEFLACSRNRFEHNLVWFERTAVAPRFEVNIGAATDPASFVFAGNLWYAADAPERSAVTLPVPETDALIGLDPQLIDVGAGDYRPHPSSPAIHSRPTDAPPDFLGTLPSARSAPGAFEPASVHP